MSALCLKLFIGLPLLLDRSSLPAPLWEPPTSPDSTCTSPPFLFTLLYMVSFSTALITFQHVILFLLIIPTLGSPFSKRCVQGSYLFTDVFCVFRTFPDTQ